MFPPLVPAASPSSRRTILFGLAAAATPIVPALATTLGGLPKQAAGADPILAVIATHRAACTRYDQAGKLYHKLRAEEEKTTDLWGRCKGINLGEQEELDMESFTNDEGELDWRTFKTGRVITVWTNSPVDIEM